ncbi:DUF2332 domain-containing protein [Flavisphingomonas formosensis]|uniref:DUF2332 domain-containing protein n=1 Tax=Flavisphingomonas formosensis TaxID=861534 RepID=UPI0012FC296D|nr:DUF2332 family protein [Sphingomonas formosensis]
MADSIDDGGEFARQAAMARDMGSPFVAQVLEAARRHIAMAPRTAARIAAWPGDRMADAVALRVNGALHALARRGVTPALTALYRELAGDFDAAIGEALAQQDAMIAEWLNGPPQTNEVGRSAAIWAALMTAARDMDLPFELLELGSSAGLNLNLMRYGYDLGGVRGGDPASPVQLRPQWRGPSPQSAEVRILAARGADLDPLDIREAQARERLTAFVWADDRQRAARLAAAIAIAEAHPPRIDRADAADWIEARLAEPQAEGVARAVFHSIVMQYLPMERRERVRATIEAAGARATAQRPLAWIAFEWDKARDCAGLTLTRWPGGIARRLADCQAHGAWIDWQGG